uniref:Ovule protein n=1 Tax=Haemonchus placei TaxID=6290 RepID=A0A0N4WH04_HAEPC
LLLAFLRYPFHMDSCSSKAFLDIPFPCPFRKAIPFLPLFRSLHTLRSPSYFPGHSQFYTEQLCSHEVSPRLTRQNRDILLYRGRAHQCTSPA